MPRPSGGEESMVVMNDKANGNPHVGAGSHARPGEGACLNIGTGHARPVASRPHNVVKANTALNDTSPRARDANTPLLHGKRTLSPYRTVTNQRGRVQRAPGSALHEHDRPPAGTRARGAVSGVGPLKNGPAAEEGHGNSPGSVSEPAIPVRPVLCPRLRGLAPTVTTRVCSLFWCPEP